MKKLISILGFAVMANLAFAQSVQINQTGTLHKADVTQENGISNATIDQLGTNNNVTVASNGNNNSVVVEQNGGNNGTGTIPVANMGFIKQVGDQNSATLKEGTKDNNKTSWDADGLIDQKGNQNTAVLNIDGQYMNFTTHGIHQTQQDAVGTKGNTAIITQSNYNNDMDVSQIGSENLTTGITKGQNNQYFVDQTGLKNTATVTQIGDNNGEFGYNWGQGNNANGTVRNWDILSQNGDRNTGYVYQHHDSKFNMTQIAGNDNKAMIEEVGYNTVKTLQDGNSNIIGGIVDCVNTDVAIFENHAEMYATQLGNNNKLYVSTAGILNVTQDNHLSSTVIGNTIKYTQTATGNATLNQKGDNNLIWLKNTSISSPMDVDVNQVGDGNMVGSTYDNGIPTTCAKFSGTHLDIDQIGGNNNKLNLDSQIANAWIGVNQNGSNNWASVVQK